MTRLTINPQPGYEAYVSDTGYYCITSECNECGRDTTFCITPEIWLQIKSFFDAYEVGGEV